MNLAFEAQTIVLNDCQKYAALLNPAPGMDRALTCIQHEQRRKKAAEEGPQPFSRETRESSGIKRAHEIIANNKAITLPTSRNHKHRNAKAVTPPDWQPPFAFPIPRNQSQYSPPEVVALLVDPRLLPKKHAGNAKRYLIDNKLVPLTTSNALAKVVRKAQGDPQKAPTLWGDIGRPPLCAPTQFQAEFDSAMWVSGTMASDNTDVESRLVQLKEAVCG